MKLRRILATAVAAAVTTPVVLLSAAPAFADEEPAASQTQKQKPTILELRRAVAKAQAAYDAAAAASAEITATLDELAGDKHPLAVAAAKTEKESKEAAAAQTAAETKLEQAKKDLAALPTDAPADERTAHEQAVTTAEAEAAAAKTTAETKAAAAKQALKALNDARMAAFGELAKAQAKKKKAAEELDAAKKALADALADPSMGTCSDDTENKDLVTSVTGPAQITAGGSGVFTFRVTNKGTAPLEKVDVDVDSFGMERIEQDHTNFEVSWSTPADSSLAPGESLDVKLKLTVGAATKADIGALMANAWYLDKGVACGWADEGSYIEFGVTKPHKPAPAKPGSGSTGGNGNTTQQGQSTTSVNTGTSGSSTTSGSLAATGAGSATLPIALAGGAAVVLGAGAMVLVRRRKAGSDA